MYYMTEVNAHACKTISSCRKGELMLLVVAPVEGILFIQMYYTVVHGGRGCTKLGIIPVAMHEERP